MTKTYIEKQKIKALKKYTEEANKMNMDELKQAYIKCCMARTVFSSIPQRWLDDLIEGG